MSNTASVTTLSILREAAEKFEQGYAFFPLRDSNGNTVGRASLTTGD